MKKSIMEVNKMVDEEPNEEPKEESKEEPKLSVLEETKLTLQELKKEREAVTKLRDELSQLHSDQLLAGTSGGNVNTKPVELSNKDYANQALAGELNVKKD